MPSGSPVFLSRKNFSPEMDWASSHRFRQSSAPCCSRPRRGRRRARERPDWPARLCPAPRGLEKTGGFQKVSIQPRPVIHLPGPASSASSLTLARNIRRAGCRFSRFGGSAVGQLRRCDSASRSDPGTTVLPLRSIVRVAGPEYFFASSFEPTKTNALAFDRDRFGLRLRVVYRVNVAVKKNRVRRFGGLAVRNGGRRNEGENERQNKMLHVQFGARFSRKAAIPSLASADSRASM